MELVLILVVFIVVVGATAGAVTASRRRRRAVELEPPRPTRPSTTTRPAGRRPSAPPRPTTPTGPSPVEPAPPVPPDTETDTDLDESTVAEIEEALAPVDVDVEDRVVEELEPEPIVKPSFRERLTKARSLFSGYVGSVVSRGKIDQGTWDDLEEAMIRADVGLGTTTRILDELRTTVKEQSINDPRALLEALKAQLKVELEGERALRLDEGKTNVWLFVGVNGVGKTTTIGKLGRRLHSEGRTCVMAAGDTFRAAAAEQLETWAERAGADLVRGNEGGDPSSVIFDAVQRAAARQADVVLADTAGRLHTKVNLMEELRKVRRVAGKEPGHVTEVLLVLDATTGQNGLVQASQFTEAVEVTGVVLTKLDGSAKGGIVLAIQAELGIPVKLVGLGETADDLVDFDADEFVEALFAE